MRRKLRTISLESVKEVLRRGGLGWIENFHGWCVYAEGNGNRFYVVDGSKPVLFREIGPISGVRKPLQAPTIRN